MKARLHHLRSTVRSTLQIQGALLLPPLVGLGALLLLPTARRQGDAFFTLAVTFVASSLLAFVAAVAMSSCQSTVGWPPAPSPGRNYSRLPHPTLPLSPHWRAVLSASAWLPAWLLVVGLWAVLQRSLAGYADGTNLASNLVAGPSAWELLPAWLLVWPVLVVFGFDRRLTHARFLWSAAPVAAALTAARALGGMESLGRLAATGAILLVLALTVGQKVAALSLDERGSRLRGRVQALRLPPLAPAAALRRQVLRGSARSLGLALPWMAVCTALVLAVFHWLYVTAPPEAGQLPPELHFVLPIIGVALALWVGSAGLFPAGTRLSAATAEEVVSGWRGPWARHWSLLPVTRRQLFHATYWPMLAAAALALFFLIGWHFLVPTYALSVRSHPWVLPIGAAYCGALTALNCAGLLGHQRLFRVSVLLALASLTLLCFGVLLDTSELLALSGAFAAVLALFIPPWLYATSDRPLLD